jgi:hypothetical protein
MTSSAIKNMPRTQNPQQPDDSVRTPPIVYESLRRVREYSPGELSIVQFLPDQDS